MLHKSAEIGLKISHSCNILGRFLPADMISTTTNKIFIPMGVMYLPTGMFCTLSDMTSIPMGECIYMLVHSVHLLAWLLYLWVQSIYMQEHSVRSLIQLQYQWVQCIYMQEHSVHSLIWSYTHLHAIFNLHHEFLQVGTISIPTSMISAPASKILEN